jgi:monoamine oxidase
VSQHVDVVVIGAGLAGLNAALRLQRAGLEVRVLDASDAVGGRIRTDHVDGLLLDRGFQLFNPSYPAATVFDHAALHLHPFRAGVAVSLGERRYVLGDPRRWPGAALPSVQAPVGSLAEKLRFARWALLADATPGSRILAAEDRTLAEELGRHGLDGRIGDTVLRPFLAGVLGDGTGASSARLTRLLVKAFVRGTPALPAAGMQALPEQLAGRLRTGSLALNTRAVAVSQGRVETDDGVLTARAVLVAADPVRACALVGLPAPPMNALTTYYHRSDLAPTSERVLHVDGERRGPVVNTAVVSNAAPSYARSGCLIASTVLGSDDSQEEVVRRQAGLIYGVSTAAWEHVATYAIPHALPAMAPPLNARQEVDLKDGIFVAGDHRDTASIQGALVSGRRAATAVLRALA